MEEEGAVRLGVASEGGSPQLCLVDHVVNEVVK